MEKPCIVSYGDNKDINKKEAQEAVYHRQQNETDPGQSSAANYDRSGAKPVNETAYYGAFYTALKAGCTVKEGDSGAAYHQVPLEGEEEDCEAVI